MSSLWDQVIGVPRTRAQATIDTSNPGQVNLVVTGSGSPASLKWSNVANSGAWDTDVSSNWYNIGTGSLDLFYSGDSALFDDTPGVPTSVSVNGIVSPGAITVNSSTNNYTLDGSGTISGTGSLTKLGSSTLTLNVLGNMTGPVTIAGGTIATANSTLASVSSITITNGGTLDFDGTTMAGNKPIVVSGAGVNGNGALVNNGGALYGSQVLDITMAGDTTFGGGNNRWDLAPGSMLSGKHNIRINEGSGGYAEWNAVTVATNVGDMEIVKGSLGLKGLGGSLGDPTGTVTVDPGSALTIWNSSSGPNSGYDKNFYIGTNSQFGVRTSPDTYFNGNVTLESNAVLYYYNGSGSGQTMNGAYTLDGIVHLQIGDSAVTFTNVISGVGGFVWNIYNNEVVFTASNTYSGPTVIGAGLTLGLSGNGSISHSSLVFFGGSDPNVTHVDASGRSGQALTLASGQTLAGIGGVNGSLVVSAGATLSPAGTNTMIGITTGSNSVGTIAASAVVTLNGTTVIKLNGSGANDEVQAGAGINYGGTLDLVNISGSSLAAGDSFQIFNGASYSGSFASIAPSTPGVGLAWDTTQLNSGKISVVSAEPSIGGVTVSGGNLILSGTGGTNNGTYYVLTSTNVATPLANWMPVATNMFDANGNFSATNTINPNSPQQFYIIKMP